jgi:hypothetical protein
MPGDGQVESYRLHAATCVLLAQKIDDAESKLALLDMAQAWVALADQAEKNSQATLVFELSPSRSTQ